MEYRIYDTNGLLSSKTDIAASIDEKATFEAERTRLIEETTWLYERAMSRNATNDKRAEDFGYLKWLDALRDLPETEGFTYESFMAAPEWPDLDWYLENTEKPMTQLEFMDLFTTEEELVIETAAGTDKLIAIFQRKIAQATAIYLSDQRTQDGILYLASQDIITAERSAQILAGELPT